MQTRHRLTWYLVISLLQTLSFTVERSPTLVAGNSTLSSLMYTAFLGGVTLVGETPKCVTAVEVVLECVATEMAEVGCDLESESDRASLGWNRGSDLETLP